MAVNMMRLLSHSMLLRASSAEERKRGITLGRVHVHVYKISFLLSLKHPTCQSLESRKELELRGEPLQCGCLLTWFRKCESFQNWVNRVLTFLDNMHVFQRLHHHLSYDHLVFLVLLRTLRNLDCKTCQKSILTTMLFYFLHSYLEVEIDWHAHIVY